MLLGRSMQNASGDFFLLICAFLWGGTFSAIKLALDSSSPTLFLALRFGLAFLILLPFYFKKIRRPDKRTLAESVILGILLFASFETQMIGLKFTTATKSGFITGTFVIFTPLFQAIFERRMLDGRTILGVLIVVLGLFFISAQENSAYELLTVGNFNFGDFMTIICAVIISVYIIYLDRISANHDPIFLTMIQVGITAFLALGFTFIFDLGKIERAVFEINLVSASALLYTSIFASVITTILQTKYQRTVTPARASLLFSLEPVFSALVAYFLVGERLGAKGIAGAFLIIAGILVSEVRFVKESS